MATKNRKTLAALRADPPRLSPEQRARLASMTDDQIDAAARADDVNPDWSDETLARAAFARDVRLARERSGLTQPDFAARYAIGLARLRNWEQARHNPDSVAVAYIKTILHAPTTVRKALAAPVAVSRGEPKKTRQAVTTKRAKLTAAS